MGQPTERSHATEDPEILVVGAGPTGLALASALAQRGVPLRLVDESLGPSQRSKALLLQPRSLEILDDLGIVDTVIQEGLPLAGVAVHVDREPPIPIDLDVIDTTYPFPLALPQDHLEDLLLDHLATHGIHAERGRRLDGLHLTPEGVEAELVTQGGTTETASFNHVVGCDGRYSTTRELADIPFQASHITPSVLLCDATLAGSLPTDRLSLYLQQGGAVMATPLATPGRFRLAIRDTDDRPEAWAPTEQTLQALLDDLMPGSVIVDEMRWGTRWQPDPGIAACFHQGQILLAGDAAHSHVPIGAQGMNSGLQDAHALAWRLSHVHLDQTAGPQLLATYDTERRRAARAAATVCQRLDRLAWSGWRDRRIVRRHLLPWLLGQGPVRRRTARWLSQTGISYARSPLSEEHVQGILPRLQARGEVRAGDRVPDAVLGRPDGSFGRLYEETRGPHHVLLLLAGHLDTHPAVQDLTGCGRAALEHLGSGVQILWIQPRHDGHPHGPGGQVRFQSLRASEEGQIRYRSDPEGRLHRRLGARRPSLCLIRPDGHAAVVQHPPQPAALEAYLARWYLPLPEPEDPATKAARRAHAPPAPRVQARVQEDLEAWSGGNRVLDR